MTRALIIVLFLSVLVSSSRIYRPSYPPPLAHPVAFVPPSILWGIVAAESDGDPRAMSKDGRDHNLFQIRDPEQYVWEMSTHRLTTTKLVIRRLVAARRILGSWDMAITSHRWGIRGAQEHGVDAWYVARVRGEL